MGSFDSSDEEVLELNADYVDILSDGEAVLEVARANNLKLNEFVWLKFFRKGKLSLSGIYDELLNYLINGANLCINGLFFKDDSDVLVEVIVDGNLKSYLLSIYEERLGTKILKNKSIANIVELCDGKFSKVINNLVVFFAILSDVKANLLPCKFSKLPYGLSNCEVISIESEGFEVDERFSVYETFSLIKEEIAGCFYDCFIGMRLEFCDETLNTARIRMSMKHEYLSVSILSKLKKIFGKIFFSAFTIHVFPINRFEEICQNFSELHAAKESILLANDLIYPKKTKTLGKLSKNSFSLNNSTGNREEHKRNKRMDRRRRVGRKPRNC
jgi:hypothetical protein